MRNISLQNNVDTLPLDAQYGFFPQEALSLRGWEPDTSVNSREMSVSMPARQVELTLTYVQSEDRQENSFAMLMSILHQATVTEPLTVTLESDLDGRKWFQHASVSKVEAASMHPTIRSVTIKFELLDGWWYSRSSTIDFTTQNKNREYLDLPTNAPYDLAAQPQGVVGEKVVGLAADSVMLQLKLNGAISRPTITCDYGKGRNSYAYNSDILAGEVLTVDPLDHTVMIGTRNVISAAERGNGLNSGAYIFQPIPLTQQAGSSSWKAKLTWTKGLAFSITPYYRSLNIW